MQLEKNFYSYQAGYLKHLYRMAGYNENFESWVSDGTNYDTYYIRFNEYNKSEYQWGDYIMEDSTVIIAVANGSQAATDVSAILTAALGTIPGDNCVIVSLDKDLDQIVGWHYNFVKHLGYYIKPEEALVKLYTQMLTGDAADNIKGLFRVGPVKAAKIIGDTTDELELYNKVLEAYEGDAERVLENAQLLFLRRYEGQIWTPPQA